MLADHAAIPVLAVTDLDRAREFYEGTLGFSSGPEVPDGVIYRTSNGGFLVYPSAYAGTNKATGKTRHAAKSPWVAPLTIFCTPTSWSGSGASTRSSISLE